MGRSPLPVAARFWAKVENTSTCWLWRGRVGADGYGKFSSSLYGTRQAHRIAWYLTRGEIPAETLDHLCRIRKCVRPSHLEPVSIGENVLRGSGPIAEKARQTTCKRGHPLSGPNLRTHKRRGRADSRDCRTCTNARVRYEKSARRISKSNGLEPRTGAVAPGGVE